MRFSHCSHSRGNEDILKSYSSNKYIAHSRHSYIINHYMLDVTLFLTKKNDCANGRQKSYCVLSDERI